MGSLTVQLPSVIRAGVRDNEEDYERACIAAAKVLRGPTSLWPVSTGRSKRAWRTVGKGFRCRIFNPLTYASFVEAGYPNPDTKDRAKDTLQAPTNVARIAAGIVAPDIRESVSNTIAQFGLRTIENAANRRPPRVENIQDFPFSVGGKPRFKQGGGPPEDEDASFVARLIDVGHGKFAKEIIDRAGIEVPPQKMLLLRAKIGDKQYGFTSGAYSFTRKDLDTLRRAETTHARKRIVQAAKRRQAFEQVGRVRRLYERERKRQGVRAPTIPFEVQLVDKLLRKVASV